jgi:hypothetical protein
LRKGSTVGNAPTYQHTKLWSNMQIYLNISRRMG